MSARDLRARGISTVEGSNRPNPFPGKGAAPKVGNQYPRQVGVQPKVVRKDTMEPILPKGMTTGKMIDESVNGQPVDLRKMM